MQRSSEVDARSAPRPQAQGIAIAQTRAGRDPLQWLRSDGTTTAIAIALALVLIVALVARVAWVVYVHPDPTDGRFDDTAIYRASAEYIAEGRGYVQFYTLEPTAAWPPLYPAFLGGVFKIAGTGDMQTYWANVVLQLALVVLVFLIGLELFNARAALIAAAAMALWPGQVFFASLTLSEPLFAALFAAAFLAAIRAARADAGAAGWLALVGVLGGLAALTRGQGLIIVPFCVVLWMFAGCGWRTALRHGALVSVVFAATLTPWVVRNAIQIGSPVLSTNMGGNLWIGHHAGATGGMHVGDAEPPMPERTDLTGGELEVAVDRLRFREAVRFAFTHPLDEIRLAGIKTRVLYESDASALDWNSAYRTADVMSPGADTFFRRSANGYWFSILALSIMGSARLIGIGGGAGARRAALVLPVIVIAWTGVHIVFFGDPRFHYPIEFALALLAAWAVDSTVRGLGARRVSTAKATRPPGRAGGIGP